MGIVSGSFSSSEYQQNPKNTQNRYTLRAAKIKENAILQKMAVMERHGCLHE